MTLSPSLLLDEETLGLPISTLNICCSPSINRARMNSSLGLHVALLLP
jgi:hypothetical protein